MPDLPARIDLDTLRIQAEGRPEVAREYGFASWAELEREVARRRLLDSLDLPRIEALLVSDPGLATERMEHWCDHERGATPLGYVAMLRFDAPRLGLDGPLDGTGAVARALLAAGAPVEGDPGDRETPLITAASYGDPDVARALIDAGADLEAVAAPDAGGVPGGTALLHAAVFGMTDVVDVLAAAGATVHGIVEAAAVGDVSAWLTSDTPEDERVRALTMAAAHDRLAVLEALLAAGTPVDAVDPWGSTALQAATENGSAAAAELLRAAGA